jgi:outer membrane protein OmpA-like peptidoglycan-associated protein
VGCAKTPVVTPEVAPTVAGVPLQAVPVPVPGRSAVPGSPPSPDPPAAPFTDRELTEELRRQGLGASTAGGAASRSGGRSANEELPEIKETPRGIVITLPHAYFAFDRADLDPAARLVVERMAYVLNHPRALSRMIILEGHADAIGTEAYNLALSRRRAETVARELIAQGLRQARVTVVAYGASRPVAPNRHPDGTDNPEGRAQNRRVEAVIRQ